MKKILVLVLAVSLFSGSITKAEDKPNKVNQEPQYSVELTITNIPKGQQTLFVPLMLDSSIVDVEKVSLDDLAASNILVVSSDSMGMSGAGVGLIKFDDDGLPETLKVNVSLAKVTQGSSEISLVMVSDEPALPSKGIALNSDVTVNIKTKDEVEVKEKLEKDKKRLILDQNKITLKIQRQAQKEETIFIPVLFNKSIIDIDESFGHAILGPGIAAKTYSAYSLNNEGGPGVEIVLSPIAEKDFTLDIDLIPKGIGKSKILFALPQKTKTAVIQGPKVEIYPTTISIK